MAELATILFNFVGAAVGAFYGALIIQIGTKLVAKFKPTYKKAYLAALSGYIASFIVGFILGIIFAKAGIVFSKGIQIFFLAIGCLTQATAYSLIIKTPEGVSLSFIKACLISIMQIAAVLLLIFLIGSIFYIFKIPL